ncbi:aldehyde dehydrogenase family protein [Muribaculum sp. An289]|uniref:aldehyde dehydrogenase n=1 Tax=unclassified Muribaculum TaxID=2622126 RepID=UPI000B36EEF5|nr:MULTISPECIES: aldehyde dehydrogenase [unclassified Muribaculum]OUO36640.1 aldehyde dehydrogenase family protein [Muribaculum sp. An289]OUO42399.1 aldehyde dehydrogenase family protein [Muribaculum sp. An287]
MDIIGSSIERARGFFASGTTRDPSFRKEALKRLRDNIRSMEDEIFAALDEDLGKSATESYMTETGMVLESIGYMLRHLGNLSRPRRTAPSIGQAPGKATIYPEPYGTALIISPWNYPLLLALDPLVAAIAAGNCCILKPSEYAPATSLLLHRLISRTFDPGHVCIIEGGSDVGEALLECRFDYIFYTGGKTVGRIVMEKASRHLTPVTLELGGKSPVVVLDDADVDVAARRIAFGKLLNCGQTCVAPDYLLVGKGIKERFIRAFIRETEKMYGSQPMESPDYGKIINRRHFDRLSRFISMADRNGSTGSTGEGHVVYGGMCDPERSKIAPTLLTEVTWNSAIMQEEIFGPILPILETESLEDAIAHISSGERPLAAYIFTGNRKLAEKFIRTVPFGGGCINDTIMQLASPRLPFGGTGESGIGTYHGKWGFRTFTHYKSILSKGTSIDPPFRYAPYNRVISRLIHRLIG